MARKIQSADEFDVVVKPSQIRTTSTLANYQKSVYQRRLEREVVREIMSGLKNLGMNPVKNHGSAYAKRGRPDIEVLVPVANLPFAVPLAIEVKRSASDQPRKQQAYRMKAHTEAGGVAVCAYNFQVVEAALDQIYETALKWRYEIRGE